MAKLVANKYYTSKGQAKVNTYLVSIAKKLVQQAGFNSKTQIKITAEKGKIIIEEDK